MCKANTSSPIVCAPDSWKHPSEHLNTVVQSPWYRILVQLLDEVHFATTSFFKAKGIRYLFTPLTTHSISSPIGLGSDSVPVSIQKCGLEVYLADSMQFLLELGTRIHEKGVYYMSCSFRGEQVDHRHLAEFFHSEVEIRGTLDDIIELAGQYVHDMTRHLYNTCYQEIISIAGSLDHIERLLAYEGKFPQVKFQDLFSSWGTEHGCFNEVAVGSWSISEKGERRVIEEIGDIVWLTHMPQVTSPFYQMPEPGTCYCYSADLLMGFGEVIGAGQRCCDLPSTLASLNKHEVDSKDYSWYLEMKEKVPLQTAGFGLGVERFLMWIMKASDIRNCAIVFRENGVAHEP